MDSPHFTHSSDDGDLSFCGLAIRNNAAVNILVCLCVNGYFCFFWVGT